MHTALSKDGTRIAYWQSGHGPPLVLVHGTTADHTRWAPILPQLQERFTVFAMDRRGRGGSGDVADYVQEREFEDIAAVVEAAAGAGKANLLGHSYGALCSLEAALRTDKIDKLVLYEPPIPAGVTIYPPGSIERLEALLAQGQKAAVVETFLREIVKMPAAELAMLKAAPNWNSRVEAAHTIPRELRADEAFVFRPERFAALRTPALLLLGGDSPPLFKAAIESVQHAVRSSRVEILPGQQHVAINTAPQMFLDKVLGFIDHG
jgi:pimeloyl-ACP methyl ester carboxylesterase